ncbi:MAG TPA: serine hydrolase [Thermomicrobiales bacterium]|nr:serine hydrolase [Thermomicrobiales bacterium]
MDSAKRQNTWLSRQAYQRLAFVALLLIVTLTATGCDALRRKSTAHPTVTPTAAPRPATPPPSAPQNVVTPAPTGTANEIDQLLFGESGIYGVVLMEADGTPIYTRNCTTPFVAASLYKLVLLANIYQMREAGELGFDQVVALQPEYFPGDAEPPDSYFDLSMAGGADTIDDLVFATGAYSSNVAARALLDLTTHESLNATARDLGLVDTHLFVDPATLPDWPPTPDANTRAADTEEAMRFAAQSAREGPINVTTPCDVTRYFQLLYHGQIVNQQASAELLDILSQQAVDDRFPVLLPAGAAMAHKTGNLDHVVHDAGIIYHGDHATILTAMSEGMDDDERSTEIIQRLALIAYDSPESPPLLSGAITPTGAASFNDGG